MAGTLQARNYTFVFGAATLTVAKAVLVVTPYAAPTTYGKPVSPILSSFSGFVNGDGLAALTGA